MLIIVNLQLDWRFAFWIAGTIMLISGIHWYVRIRNAPEEVGLPTIEEEDKGKTIMGEVRQDTHLGFEYTIGSIIRNKTVWFASLGLFSLNIVRYGITEWLPYIIASEALDDISFALWKTIAFPLGGIIGALVCAWISDNYLGRRRMPIVTVLFGGLGLALIAYLFIPPLDMVLGIPMLIIIGFLVFGPHVLLVSTIPMEFGTRKAASTASGFIDGWGYVGATVTSYGSAVFLNAFGSEGAIMSWALVVMITGLILILNWKSVPDKKEYF